LYIPFYCVIHNVFPPKSCYLFRFGIKNIFYRSELFVREIGRVFRD